MLYELKKGRTAYITFNELLEDSAVYNFPQSTINDCQENFYNFRSDPYVQSDLFFCVLDLLNFYDVFGEKNRLAIYLQPELCLFVGIKDTKEQIKDLFFQVVEYYEKSDGGEKQWSPDIFLYHFLDNLIRQDRKFLENMEFHMSALETRILQERLDCAFVNEILSMKRELMYLRNYYEQLIDIGEILQDNENAMLPAQSARLFSIYIKRVNRLSDTVRQLKEYTVQLRETHDAMLDYNLNNIMKLFTVITTIFMPLTLIVGWYGMNFEYMPELHWRYGYLAIVMVSMVVVGGCFVLFRKHKLL